MSFLKSAGWSLLLVWMGINPVWTQPLSLLLKNQSTDQPVSEAFVFIANSSIGTTSDEAGSVSLGLKGLSNGEIIISHLNYETKLLSLNDLNAGETVIYLSSKTQVIEVITVRSKSKASKRKRWLKKFDRAFLGTAKDRRKVTITNPEVILFEQQKDGLRAEVQDYININNEALGYELQFYLDTFFLSNRDEVLYSGRVFFKELSEEESNAARWERARQKAYRDSKMRFFRALLRGKARAENYEIGQAKINEELYLQKYQPKSFSELNIHRGVKSDTLFFSDYLTIIDKSIITERKDPRSRQRDDYATSFLRAKNGKFIISHAGVLLNPAEIEEIGYWTEQRAAKLLPIDYKP